MTTIASRPPSRRSRLPSAALSAVLPIAAACLLGCSARLDASLRPDGGASVSVRAGLEPRTAALLANLGSFGAGGGGASGPLDAALLSRSLKAAPGVAAASFRNPDARSVDGTVSAADLSRLFAAAPAAAGASARLFKVRTGPSGGSFEATLDRASAPALLASLSPEVEDALAALMAPVATGEEIPVAEYLEAVASMYGPDVAAEISKSRLVLEVALPGPAASVRGGTADGVRAKFDLALADVLVLEKPVSIGATWK